MGDSITLGTVTITDPYDVTQHYECAAWYTIHTVQPGTYDVWWSGDRVGMGVRTVIKAEHFPALFGGVAIGGPNKHDGENVGKASTYAVSLYDYMMPESLADTPGESVRLFGGEFTPADGAHFEACWSVPREGDPSRRYGTAPTAPCVDCGGPARYRTSGPFRCIPCVQAHWERVGAR